TPLLDAIKAPSDIRKLGRSHLPALCGELRDELVSTISQIGGHFASSLGVVELSVALHYVLETPEDRIVWDTGHQGYIHKILTGRRSELHRVRQFGGISGFLRREESEYDSFGAGHAGTSISAAAGMVEASFHSYPGQRMRHVAAVIGDGSMTAGMAFEAYNHAGQLHRPLIVVLNDNEMSIAPNVGALSWGFSRAVTGKLSTSARRHFKSLHERGIIPDTFYRAIDRAEEATQGFLSAPGMLFGAFGFRYIGPIDGHNVEQVVDALERAKRQDGPVLVHVLTMKGKGYGYAEEDPVKYHGVTPFVPVNGEFMKPAKPPKRSFTQVFGDAMIELCKMDPRVVGVTAAMPDGTGLKGLQKEMPDRYFDVGIAEQHAVTFAAGLACEGMVPVVAIYSTFLQRGYDQILHDVCIQSLPVVFAMDRGGLVGADGATHHGVFDIAFLRSMPNIVIMAPKDEAELRDMLYTSTTYSAGPTAIRYPRGDALGVELPAAPRKLQIGKGEVVRAGTDPVVLIGFGNTVNFCADAADELAATYGVQPTVVNLRFVKPLDRELLRSCLSSANLIVTVEDHVVMGGMGAAIVEFMADENLFAGKRVVRLGIADEFVEHGTQQELYRLCGFDVPAIVERVRNELGATVARPLMTANVTPAQRV
ncbi:MAG: 1-deoxy-D-xylulose-5-phosphate synthase, partial [Deltaproteobacteria bacterium]|nr:1-deoxy-D-xylulose-5-phosphate synthase [Deltaproteobacteria bacterium]